MRRAWAAAAAVLTLSGAAVGGGAQRSDARTTAGAAQAATAIELTSQTASATVDGALDLRVRVTGAPAGATAQLHIYEKLLSRQDFTDSLGGDRGEVEATSPPQPVALEANGTMQISYPVGPGGAGLGQDDHGVYPVSVVVAAPGGDILVELTTYLVVQPDPSYGFAPLSVAVILGVGAPPGLQPDGIVNLSPDELAAIEARVAILEEVGSIPLTVAPVPETLDALADGGSATQPTLDRLTRALAGRKLLAQPYVDLDLGALAVAEMLDQVPPEADAGAQTVRSLLGVDPISGLWLAGPGATQATADALREFGVPQAVVPSRSLASVPDDIDVSEGVTGPVRLAQDGPVAVVADDALAARLLGQEGALDVQRFVAELAIIWALEPAHARGVAVQIPSTAALDRDVVGEALTALGGAPSIVQPVTLEEMFTVPPAGGGESPAVVELTTDTDDEAIASLDAVAGDLVQGQTELNGLAGMLDDGRLVRQLQRSLWISPGSETPNAERRSYVDRVRRTEDEFAAAINAPQTFRITLTAREGTIPLSIDNLSDQTVSVRIDLASSQMEFPDGSTLNLDVPPGGTRVDLDVRLRASGAFPLRVTITSPDGSIVLDRTTFTVRSTVVSGVGLVLSIGAGLFLLIWWARHWRTSRRSSQLVRESTRRHATPAIERRDRPVPVRRP